jgi:2,3-bisphosphoglycerate-independent phosphoglycerate mutase
MKTGIFLLILDGFGIGVEDLSNPVYLAKMENLKEYYRKYPFGILQASGPSVGIGWGEAGNCEIGHLTIGCGRAIFQDYVRILNQIKDGSFYENKVIKDAATFAKLNKKRIHLLGALSYNIHETPLDLWKAILDFFKRENLNVFLHLFVDSSSNQNFLNILKEIEFFLDENIKIGTVVGSSYALDREKNWTVKTQQAFNLITKGEGNKLSFEEFKKFILESYKDKNFKLENIRPTIIDQNSAIKDSDVLVFLDLNEDSILQLAKSFLESDDNFNYFKRDLPQDLYIITVTKYPISKPKYNIRTILEEFKIETHLTKELFLKEKNIFKITESSKAINLNFHFNGYIQDPYPNEYRKIMPPSDILQNPLLNTIEIFDNVIQGILDGIYDLIIANIAATDLVAHTGDINLAIKTLKELDDILKDYIEKIISYNWIVILTSDHGNIERMLYAETGKPQKIHDPNPVPFLVIKRGFERDKTEGQVRYQLKNSIGTLADIAPTILWFFDIEKPDWMLGKNLINFIF